MKIHKSTLLVSPIRFTVTCMSIAAVWLFAPEIAQAAVTFGEIGQNIAENSKGIAKGITMAGLCRRRRHGRVGHGGHV